MILNRGRMTVVIARPGMTGFGMVLIALFGAGGVFVGVKGESVAFGALGLAVIGFACFVGSRSMLYLGKWFVRPGLFGRRLEMSDILDVRLIDGPLGPGRIDALRDGRWVRLLNSAPIMFADVGDHGRYMEVIRLEILELLAEEHS